MSENDVREFLTEYEKKAYPDGTWVIDDVCLIETLFYKGECVYEALDESRRWFQRWEYVYELEGKYIRCYGLRTTGDYEVDYDEAGMEALGGACFVEKKTRTIEETYYE
jgi:hypothetical protein